MNNAENIARLTDCVPPEIDLPNPCSEGSILDAQTILDGAYNELVQSGTVEAGKMSALRNKRRGGILGRSRGRFQTCYAGRGRGTVHTPFFLFLSSFGPFSFLFFPAFTAQWARRTKTNVSPFLYLFFDFVSSVSRIQYSLYLVSLQDHGNTESIELGRQCLFADPRQQVHLRVTLPAALLELSLPTYRLTQGPSATAGATAAAEK